MRTVLRILAASVLLVSVTGCIDESGGEENCKGPGPGAPGSGVDLQINDVIVAVEGSPPLVVFRINYWNAGDSDARPLSETGILMGIFLDRAECPPAGEAPDYIITLPAVIPPEAAAEIGLSIPASDLPTSGAHNAYARVDPSNDTWEVDETNNCLGPTDFTTP